MEISFIPDTILNTKLSNGEDNKIRVIDEEEVEEEESPAVVTESDFIVDSDDDAPDLDEFEDEE